MAEDEEESKRSGALQSGLRKLANASFKYDPERDRVLKEGFTGRALTPEELREMLNRLFHVKLGHRELRAVFAHFVPGGEDKLSGSVFLPAFLHLGQAERDRRYKEHQEKIRIRQEVAKQMALQRELAAQAKAEMVSTAEYTAEDTKLALAKITEAAAQYDRQHPSAVGLDAFEGSKMTPVVFREQLKRVFHIKITPAELMALMHHFDKDGDGTVDCGEFLVEFFKRGFNERSRRETRRREEEARKKEAAEAQWKVRFEDVFAAASAKQVDYSFTPEDRETAMQKLTDAAVNYNAGSAGAVGLGAFQGSDMPPYVLREMLRRVLNVKLTPAELPAIMAEFDKDGSNSVSCTEFVKAFCKLGFTKRSELHRKKLMEHREREKHAACSPSHCPSLYHSKAALKVDFKYSDAARKSAVKKITAAAVKYDKNHPSSLGLDAFEGAEMPPHVFKEQIKRVFNVKLTPAELGAAIELFDKDGDGTVNCSEFLLTFFRIGFAKRSKTVQRRRKREQEKHEMAQAAAQEKAAKEEAKNTLEVNFDFSEAERASGLTKLQDAAIKYDKNHPSSVGLNAFEGAVMPPHVFKEQLKRVFNVKLSPAELGAVFTHFDGDGSGTIGCNEFLLQFFRMGFEGRNALLRKSREKDKEKEEQRLAEEQARLEHAAAKAMEAVAPYTEEDIDSTLEMMIMAAAHYNKRQLGPAGLKAWEIFSMTAAELREQLKHTFGMRPTPPQLGVIVHFFEDKDKPGSVAVHDFLTAFFKICPTAKSTLGHKDTDKRLRDLHKLLKSSWSQRDRVKETLQAMRHSPPKQRPATVPGITTLRPKPGMQQAGMRGVNMAEPRGRMKIRMAAAKETCKLDLSTWKNRSPSDFLLHAVPRCVWRLTDLTELWLTNNDLTTLPHEVRHLQRLRTLGAACNRIVQLPSVIGQLPCLERLLLEQNWLTSLPQELANCSQLRELRLDHNQLSTFPPCLTELRGLEVLTLRGNMLQGLPERMSYMRSLLELDLDANPLGPRVSPALLKLGNLIKLGLADTNIEPDQREIIWEGLRLD
ncbi:unnamed protein product, partial [Chrysoparadoxa australica]